MPQNRGSAQLCFVPYLLRSIDNLAIIYRGLMKSDTLQGGVTTLSVEVPSGLATQ